MHSEVVVGRWVGDRAWGTQTGKVDMVAETIIKYPAGPLIRMYVTVRLRSREARPRYNTAEKKKHLHTGNTRNSIIC